MPPCAQLRKGAAALADGTTRTQTLLQRNVAQLAEATAAQSARLRGPGVMRQLLAVKKAAKKAAAKLPKRPLAKKKAAKKGKGKHETTKRRKTTKRKKKVAKHKKKTTKHKKITKKTKKKTTKTTKKVVRTARKATKVKTFTKIKPGQVKGPSATPTRTAAAGAVFPPTATVASGVADPRLSQVRREPAFFMCKTASSSPAAALLPQLVALPCRPAPALSRSGASTYPLALLSHRHPLFRAHHQHLIVPPHPQLPL